MNLKFPTKIPMITFLFGQCSPDALPRLVEDTEAYGLEVLQVLSDLREMPRSPLAPPGAMPVTVEMLRLVVRLPKADYPAFVKKVEERNAKIQVVKGPGIQ